MGEPTGPVPLMTGGRVDYDRATAQEEKCSWAYPGAAGNCQRDAEAWALSSTLGYVPLCEEHLAQATDGGAPDDGADGGGASE